MKILINLLMREKEYSKPQLRISIFTIWCHMSEWLFQSSFKAIKPKKSGKRNQFLCTFMWMRDVWNIIYLLSYCLKLSKLKFWMKMKLSFREYKIELEERSKQEFKPLNILSSFFLALVAFVLRYLTTDFEILTMKVS